MNAKQNSLAGGFFVLPWCCIVPAGFSLLGLAGVAAAGNTVEAFSPLFILIALFFLGRAHYLIHIKKQGNRTSHVITWFSTLMAISVWAWQWSG